MYFYLRCHDGGVCIRLQCCKEPAPIEILVHTENESKWTAPESLLSHRSYYQTEAIDPDLNPPPFFDLLEEVLSH